MAIHYGSTLLFATGDTMAYTINVTDPSEMFASEARTELRTVRAELRKAHDELAAQKEINATLKDVLKQAMGAWHGPYLGPDALHGDSRYNDFKLGARPDLNIVVSDNGPTNTRVRVTKVDVDEPIKTALAGSVGSVVSGLDKFRIEQNRTAGGAILRYLRAKGYDVVKKGPPSAAA